MPLSKFPEPTDVGFGLDFNTLAVHPDRQKEGIANLLMQYFVSVADRNGLETYFQSQVIAHKIYRRLGWEDVNNFDTDLSKWGPRKDLSNPSCCLYAANTESVSVSLSYVDGILSGRLNIKTFI